MFDAEILSHMPFTKENSQGMGLLDDFDYENSTIHASLSIHGNPLMLAECSTQKLENRTNVEVMLAPDSQKQIESIYNNAIKNGAEIVKKLEKQFWGDYFARFKDQFGIGWQLNFSPPTEEEEKSKKNVKAKNKVKKKSKKKGKKN